MIYARRFSEAKKQSPEKLVADEYQVGKTWKKISDADKNNHSILPKLTPGMLPKGSDYTSKVIEKGASQIRIRFSWKNKNNITLGVILSFDSMQEAEKDGWII